MTKGHRRFFSSLNGDGPCLNAAFVLSRRTANDRDSDPFMKPPHQALQWLFVHMLLALFAALIPSPEAALPVAPEGLGAFNQHTDTEVTAGPAAVPHICLVFELTVLVTGPKDEEGEHHPFIIRTDESTLSFIAIMQNKAWAPPLEICKIDDPVGRTPANITDPLEIRPTTADAVAALALEPAKVPSPPITDSDATPRILAENTDVVVMPAGLGKPEVTHAHAQTHPCLVPVSTATTDTITDFALEPANVLASDAERHLLTADDTGDSVVMAGRQVTHAHAQTHP